MTTGRDNEEEDLERYEEGEEPAWLAEGLPRAKLALVEPLDDTWVEGPDTLPF